MDNQKIGALIAAARKEKGLTQKELGKRLHVSDRAVSKWERGLNLPDASLFEPLCGELGITVTELLRGEREEPSIPELERVVCDTAALAGKSARRDKRYRRLALLFLGLFLLAGGLLGRRVWEERRLQAYRDEDANFPSVALWYDNWPKFTTVRLERGGGRAPLAARPGIREADLRVLFQPDSKTIALLPTIDMDGADYLEFALSFQKTEMEVRVVRWPESAIGSDTTLEQAETVEYRGHWEEERDGWKDRKTFEAEPGYVYSVVLWWGDSYFMEYPFRTV